MDHVIARLSVGGAIGSVTWTREFCTPERSLRTGWDPLLILLSVLFAIVGSYVALEFARSLKSARNARIRQRSFFIGAAMMGLTVWSMHFVGMLALKMPVRITYSPGLSFVSMAAAGVGAALAFAIMSRKTAGAFHLIVGGTAMGIAIVCMHYLGMASMRMPAAICYSPGMFILSVLVAIVAATSALAFVFRVPDQSCSIWIRAGGGVTMGLAIAGMHYVGMAAATYLPVSEVIGGALSEPTIGIFNLRDVLGAAGILFGTALFLLSVQSSIERQRALDSYTQLNAELEKRVEERTARLVAANEELAAFSYTVSHDLRSPLRSIDGFSHMLREHAGELLDAESKHYLARISANTRRMGELIDGLLDLSRVARTHFTKQTVDVSDTAKAVVDKLRYQNPQRKITVTVQRGMLAQGDPTMIRSVLENLIGNAWKFTTPTPEAEIQIGETDQNNERVFFVRDNGVGFDMAYVTKLFGVYQRLHAVDEFDGTGIGLATVKRIIDRHGGRIWAEAAVNRGATFFFTLPG